MAKKLSINVPAATGFFSPETIKKAEEDAAKAAPAVLVCVGCLRHSGCRADG